MHISHLVYGVIFGCFYIPVLYVFYQILRMKDLGSKVCSFISSNVFINTLSFSSSEALLSAIFSIVLAIPGAYYFGRFNFTGKRWWRSLLVLPFMMPSIVIVLAMVIFYGQNGQFNLWLSRVSGGQWQFTGLYGFWGIVLAHVLYNLPLCIRMMGEGWERINPTWREVSANLGVGPFATWYRLTLPLLLPTIGYLFLVVFLYSFLSFTVVLLFGGYLYKTFEVLIYIEYNSKLQFEQAAMIAGLQTLVLLCVFMIQRFFHQKLGNPSQNFRKLPRLSFSNFPGQKVIFWVYNALLLIFIAAPFLNVMGRSFHRTGLAGGSISLINYGLLFSEAFHFAVGSSFLKVLGNSILLSLAVALITVGAAYFFARERRRHPWGIPDLLLQLPMGISFMSFGFGLGSLLDYYINSWFLVLWAQVFLAFPLIYSILRTAWREFDVSLLETAALLGAKPRFTFFTVEAPLLKKAIRTATAYAMAISLSDLSAVLLLGRGEVITLSVAIYRLIGHYHFAEATALGSLFILISFTIFVLIELDWVRKKLPKESPRESV